MLIDGLLHLDLMKRNVFIPVILFAVIMSGFTPVRAPVKKIYGYKQASIPGILPSYIEENDIKPISKSKQKQNFNYWFYLEIPKTERINVTGLWIEGIPHNVKTETITNIPVKKIVFTGLEKNDTTIMVPSTKNKVMLISPSGESRDTIIRSKYISNLAYTNELVIRYSWKNKTYYATVKKLKQLMPDARQ